jgi:putative mycofactocin binding protein MftB
VSGPAHGLATASADDPEVFDPDGGWRLHPAVAIRPESFGALLYHFGTRKLSFLKNRTILTVVQSLADHPDVRSACRAAGVDDLNQGPYLHALGVLARSNMLVPRESE